MSSRDILATFVGRALGAGRSREEIRAALLDAGWSDREAEDALGAWAPTGFTPPVPTPRPVVSARDFFVYALLFVALGVVAVNLVQGAHGTIDLLLPPGEEPWRRTAAAREMRQAAAALLVFGPLYVVLDRRTRSARRADPARQRSAIRKWTGALILLVTVLTLLTTLVWTLYRFIDGGADPAFLLKAVVVGAVAGGVLALWREGPG